jgi:anti-sigma-K factor RskA
MSDDRLDGVEALLAQLDVEDLEPVAPPATLWASIERQLADLPDDRAERRDDESADAAGATVHSIARRRRSVGTWVMAAAAAVAVVIAGTIIVVGDGTDEPVVAAAVLTFDPAAFDPRGADASAQARLVDRDGTYTIQLVDTQFPELGEDDLELWLIQPDAAGAPVDVAPVSLIDPDGDGVYEVPAGLDPTTHFVVDISIEPRDGVATHSGQSILRGALQQS